MLEKGSLQSGACSKETHDRLMNWGEYIRGGLPRLGYGSAQSSERPNAYDVDDAELVEFVMTSWAQASERGELLAFILKLNYAEGWGPAADRARDYRRKYDTPCRDRRFYKMLWDARNSFQLLCPEKGHLQHAPKLIKKWA